MWRVLLTDGGIEAPEGKVTDPVLFGEGWILDHGPICPLCCSKCTEDIPAINSGGHGTFYHAHHGWE